VLAAPLINVKTLASLEAEEMKLPATIASLHTRVVLLTEQVAAALKSEAHDRVSEIETDHRAITTRITERRTAFLAGVEQLLDLIRTDAPDCKRHAELQAELQYLHEAFDAPWPHVPAAQPLNRHDLNPLTAEFQKSHWLLNGGQQWREKTDALQQQRARDERAAIEAKRPSHVRMSVPSRENVKLQ
jgi:hypothetical protein